MTTNEVKKRLAECQRHLDCVDCSCREFCLDVGHLLNEAETLINNQADQINRLRKVRKEYSKNDQLRKNKINEQRENGRFYGQFKQ